MVDHGIGSTPGQPAGTPLPRCEHVWIVRDTMDHPRLPGLLTMWRRNPRGRWEGWCIYLTPGIPAHGGETSIAMGWVDAARIESNALGLG